MEVTGVLDVVVETCKNPGTTPGAGEDAEVTDGAAEAPAVNATDVLDAVVEPGGAAATAGAGWGPFRMGKPGRLHPVL